MTVKMVVPTLGRRERTVAGKVGMAETRSTGRKRTFYRPNASDREPIATARRRCTIRITVSRTHPASRAYTLHAQFRWRPRHGSDQTALPHRRDTVTLESLDAVARAIRGMQVRGAPLIGATAACGSPSRCATAPTTLRSPRHSVLAATRPTAVNLHWALDRLARLLGPLPTSERATAAAREAQRIIDEDANTNRRIGAHGWH